VFQDVSIRKKSWAAEAYGKLYIFGISEKIENFNREMFLERPQLIAIFPGTEVLKIVSRSEKFFVNMDIFYDMLSFKNHSLVNTFY